MKDNKTCIICSKKYTYCPSCKTDSHKPSWYAIFDGDNCHRIYEIVTSYRDGVYTKEQANAEIKMCDISNLESFNETTKRQVKDIISFQPVVEVVEVIEEVSEEATNEIEIEEENEFPKKISYGRRRNK